MKIWFITGTSRGFGREWTQAALERGDKVAATARSMDTLQDLAAQYGDSILPLALDVTNHDDCFAAVKTAWEHFGRLDVVVNNAGYGKFAPFEQMNDAEVKGIVDTCFYGVVYTTRAALPVMR